MAENGTARPQHKVKYILVTGGVISGIGKGRRVAGCRAPRLCARTEHM
jgi:hypothetical protein